MFNINEQNTTWPVAVRGYSTNTPVLGGDNSNLGDSNLSLKDLTDRTAYLYDRLGRFENVVIITSSGTTVLPSAKYKLHYLNIGGNGNITMDDVANFHVGAIVAFKCASPDNKSVLLQTTGSQNIFDGRNPFTQTWLCDGEELKLVAADGNGDNIADMWLMVDAKGNFDKVGQEDLVRVQPRNSIIANGCRPEIFGTLYQRADFPRLWAKVAPLAIDDSTWLSNILYQCFFSTGNGSTTFRVPDMRALVRRGLDLGRGIRLGQLDNTPGSYESDTIKVPDGVKGVKNTGNNTIGPAGSPLDSINGTGQEFDLQHMFEITTGYEVTMKNGGFIPIIYY